MTKELFRSAGHMRDLMLNKSNRSKKEDIFSSLKSETKEAIMKKSISVEMINRKGAKIELSGAEWKLIDTLSELLHERAINVSDPNNVDFYTSIDGEEMINFGNITAPSERLILTLYQITLKYKGGASVSGKDIETVKNILINWNENSEKRVLIRYTREFIRDKKKYTHEIETFQPLVQLATEKLTSEDVLGERKEVEEIIVYLNPIFRDQIETKYINYPTDLNKKMVEAWGGQNISEIMYKLRDYLAREYSAKRFRCEINLDNLYWQLSEKWVLQRNTTKIQEYLDRSIKALINLGLLKEFSLENNKTGGKKYVFTLNENWI